MKDYQRKGKFFYTVRRQRALILCILLFFCIYRPVPAFAEDQQVEVYYFYLSVCASCRDTEQYLEEVWERCSPQLEAKNKMLVISRYNTSEKENLNLLQKFFKAYQVPENQQHLPIVFFGEAYISGESNIRQRLEKELPDAETGSPVLEGEYADTDRNAAVENFNGFKTFRTFLIGFANGLTPCSLSMLLFFISLLIARNANILKIGAFYCVGKFLTYFLLGTLFYETMGSIKTEWLIPAVRFVMLAAVLIFICLNAMDLVAARKEKYDRIKLQLPTGLRGLNHKWIKAVSGIDSPKALLRFSFLLGIATSVGEFLCTGQIYLTTILYVLHSQVGLSAKALFFFLVYNIAFITPLLVITLLIHKGKELLDVSEFIRRNMHIIKLINILMFLALGLFLIFNL